MKDASEITVIQQTLRQRLIEAIAEIPTLPKDGKGNFGPYTTLETTIGAVKPILAKHGLAIVQTVGTIDHQGQPILS